MGKYLAIFLFLFSYSLQAQPELVLRIVQDANNDDELFKDFLDKDPRVASNKLNERHKELNQKISKDKKNAHLYYERALLFRKAGLYQSSMDDFKKTFELIREQDLNDRFKDSVFFDKALLWPLMNNTYEGLRQLDNFLKKYPLSKKALFFKGLVSYCFAFGNSEERFKYAILTFEELLEMDPSYYEARVIMGMCYSRLKDYDSAFKEIGRVIQEKPDVPLAYAQRGRIYWALEKEKEACQDFSMAAHYVPSFKKFLEKKCGR